MKHILSLQNILLAVVFLLLCACGSSERQALYDLEYIAFENEDADDDDEYGLLGKDGSTFSTRFEKEITPVVNGYFAMEEEDGYSICRINGDTYERIPNASGFAKVGVMNDGLIPVCKDDEHIQVLDNSGNVKFSLASVDSVDVFDCYSYSCGKMRVFLNNEQYVFVDENGHNAFGKSYKWASDFDNGYAVVGIGENKYQLIKDDGESIFTFISEDPEEIVLSTRFKKLSAKGENDIYAIYDFDGNVKYLSKMVEGIYALLEDDFIFKNDENYGLMSYQDGRDKIYAKYNQLVPNGKYFLGIPEDDDEVVKLLDSEGNELNSYDGKEIICPLEFGFDYPNIVKRPDDRIFILNNKGETLSKAENFDINVDVLKDVTKVHNLYFPVQEIKSEILSLCGNGEGTPKGEGAFYIKDGNHCHSYEISYFKDSKDFNQFEGKYSEDILIKEGVNYIIGLSYKFDEPIVRRDTNILNRSAWLQYIKVEVQTTNVFYNLPLYNGVIKALKEKGCQELFRNSNGCILKSIDGINIFAIERELYSFNIYMRAFNENILTTWILALQNKK